MRIDVHAHYYPADLVDRMEQLGCPFVAGARRNPGAGVTLEQRIEMLASAGVDVQVLSPGAQQAYLEDEAKAIQGARLANDLYKSVCDRYSARFSAFGIVPLPHVDAALAEAARCLDELKLPGLNLGCSVGRVPLDAPQLAPFWQEMEQRQAVIFLHPLGIGSPMSDAYNLDWLVAGCFEDTIAALRLAHAGFWQKYPHVKVIVPHLGGTVPYVWGRLLATRREMVEAGQIPDPLEGLKHLYYDTATRTPGVLPFACPLVGFDHVLLGTDFPYQTPAQFQKDVQFVAEANLPREQIDAILEHNATRLLGFGT